MNLLETLKHIEGTLFISSQIYKQLYENESRKRKFSIQTVQKFDQPNYLSKLTYDLV